MTAGPGDACVTRAELRRATGVGSGRLPLTFVLTRMTGLVALPKDRRIFRATLRGAVVLPEAGAVCGALVALLLVDVWVADETLLLVLVIAVAWGES